MNPTGRVPSEGQGSRPTVSNKLSKPKETIQVVRVLSVGKDGTVTVRVGRETVTARSELTLAPGDRVRVSVVRTRDGVLLRSAPAADVAAEAAAVNSAHSGANMQDRVTRLILQAFVRARLPLDSKRTEAAVRRVRSRPGGQARELADRAARAESKGLLDSDAVWAMLSSSGGQSDGESGREAEQRDGHGSPESSPASCHEVVMSAFATTEVPDSPIHVYNHVIGRGDHWIYVPIQTPDERMTAELHIRIPRAYALGIDRHQAPFAEAWLSVTSGAAAARLCVKPGPDGLTVSLAQAETGSGGRRFDWMELGKALHDADAARFVDARAEYAAADGFSSGSAADIIPRVDGSA
jgi:hypothetical protein